MGTFYDALEVSERASADEIKKQFRKLALVRCARAGVPDHAMPTPPSSCCERGAAQKWHPDKNPERREEAEDRFKRIAQAYDILSDDTKRRQYDAELRDGGPNGGGWHAGPQPFVPCAECGGVCQPGECPFAGANPFHTRFNPSFDRSNRRSGEQRRPGPSPFGSFDDDFFARHRTTHVGGGRARASFGFADADAIFRDFFGGRDPFASFGGGFGSGGFGDLDSFADFGTPSGATVHVTKTVRGPDGVTRTTTYTTTGGGGRGGSHSTIPSSVRARPPLHDSRAPAASAVHSTRGHAPGGGRVDEVGQLEADLHAAMQLSREDVDDEEERMLQAAIRASLAS
jgi:curved DNA-binding protein CbpA